MSKAKFKWGVVVGRRLDKKHYPNDPYDPWYGRFCIGEYPKPLLFDTRKEAREEAKRWGKDNKGLHSCRYHAKKYTEVR